MKKTLFFLYVALHTGIARPVPPLIEDVAEDVINGAKQKVADFITEGGDINEPIYFPSHTTTLLHLAIANLQPHIAQLLIEAGADTNAIDACKRSPLIEALLIIAELSIPRNSFWGNMYTIFFKGGGSSVARDMFYLLMGFPNMSFTLVQNMCLGKISQRDAQQLTENMWNVVQALLGNSSLDVCTPDKNSITPLLLAVILGKVELVQTLVARGASPHVTCGGYSALELAKELSQLPEASEASHEIYTILKTCPPPPAPRQTRALERLRQIAWHLITGTDSFASPGTSDTSETI